MMKCLVGGNSKKFLLCVSILGNIWGGTFFHLASVEKINSVCIVPPEANKKEYILESDMSLFSL